MIQLNKKLKMEVSLKSFVQKTINEIIEGVVSSQNDMLAKYTKPEDQNISISTGKQCDEKVRKE
jgi:hypothetical protein